MLRIRRIHQLNLRNHQHSRHGGEETTVVIALARSIADRCHHRRLLRRHRNQHVTTVNFHIGRNADRNVHGAYHVLDEMVPEVLRQVSCVKKQAAVSLCKSNEIDNFLDTLRHRFLVKAGQAAAAGNVIHGEDFLWKRS